MKLKQIIFFLSVLIFSSASAQENAPVAMLDQSDVDRYAETVVPMTKEFEELGLKMEGNEPRTYEEWTASAEAQAILIKYGWNEEFAMKFASITWGYTYLKIKQEMDKMPEDQKAQMEAMMPMYASYLNLVHEDDIKVIEPNMAKLDKVFKELQ